MQNAQVAGVRETGMDDLTREGGLLVKDLRDTVKNINGTFTRLNEEALSQANMNSLKSTLERLNETSGTLVESSKKIEGVLVKADETMASSKKAADDLQAMIADARKTVAAATSLISDARSGDGLLATLLSDKAMANDIRALVSNLRDHGILFYRDSARKAEERAARSTPEAAPPRRSRRP